MNNNLLDIFTTNSIKALNRAYFLARQLKSEEVGVEHIFIALFQQPGSLSSKFLIRTGIKAGIIKKLIIQNSLKEKDAQFNQTLEIILSSQNHYKKPLDQPQLKSENPLVKDTAIFTREPIISHAPISDSKKEPIKEIKKLSPTTIILSQRIIKEVIQKAIVCAASYKHSYIGTEHLLFGLLQLKNNFLKQILGNYDLSAEQLIRHLKNILDSTSKFSEIVGPFSKRMQRSAGETKELAETKDSQILNFFAKDLTSDKFQKNIDPLIGRESEVERLINILSRRTKNNPLLIGDPGVGKTAIIEGLAKKIAEGNVPLALANKKIITLDLGLLVAGTIYRGEFESRLKQIIEEVKSNRDIILFIDEIHTIIGAGSASGSLDAANLLKPSLAKGEIRLIGATTPQEYKKCLETDQALERRFQIIFISEPTPTESIAVLQGIKKKYEDFHKIQITEEAIEAAVHLSSRYLKNQFLPDKAIDLIDEAASRLKVERGQNSMLKEVLSLERTKKLIIHDKKKFIQEECFDQALFLKEKENELSKHLLELRQILEKNQSEVCGSITKKDIIHVVSQITKMPLNLLSTDDKERFINLELELQKNIIGQDEAIAQVSRAIRKHITGLSNPNRPLGSFLFCGPSGVGKTELAKTLTKAIFNDSHALIRFDMSEFAESFNISKLIGAPAGYVGYRESGKLTEAVKNRPYSLVLFDEIEKAHPDVYNILLQVLEDGILTDATGKEINFRNTIIVMTSNVGTRDLVLSQPIGFSSNKNYSEDFERIREKVKSELKKYFNPEFLNRIDATIIFKPLALAHLKKIVDLQIQGLESRLQEKNIKITISPDGCEFIAKFSFSPESGAREIRKTIADLIENPLAEALLRDEFKDGDSIKVDFKNGKLALVAQQ